MTSIHQQLRDAAETGNVEALRAALAAGADPNTQDSNGKCALHKAARKSHIECLNHLLASGASIDIKDNDGWTAMHWSALGSNSACLEFLLQKGADVNVQSSNGDTPLAFAMRSRHHQSARALLCYGAKKCYPHEDQIMILLEEMRTNVTTTFAEKVITRRELFTNDKPPRIKYAVLDALAVGLFETYITEKLANQGTNGEFLFPYIVNALPQRIKSLYAATLQSSTQRVRSQHTFAERTGGRSSQGRER